MVPVYVACNVAFTSPRRLDQYLISRPWSEILKKILKLSGFSSRPGWPLLRHLSCASVTVMVSYFFEHWSSPTVLKHTNIRLHGDSKCVGALGCSEVAEGTSSTPWTCCSLLTDVISTVDDSGLCNTFICLFIPMKVVKSTYIFLIMLLYFGLFLFFFFK